MKQKRKSKHGYRLANKRLLIVAIGLLVILTLAVANMAYMANYRMNAVGQTATTILLTNEIMPYIEAETATQGKIEMKATLTGEAP